jgi:hypothetical protein
MVRKIGYKNVRCTEVVVAYKCKYFTWGLPKKGMTSPGSGAMTLLVFLRLYGITMVARGSAEPAARYGL